MMTTYTRRGPGQSYLKSVLAERINSLIEHKDLNLEINPLKVSPAPAQSLLLSGLLVAGGKLGCEPGHALLVYWCRLRPMATF